MEISKREDNMQESNNNDMLTTNTNKEENKKKEEEQKEKLLASYVQQQQETYKKSKRLYTCSGWRRQKSDPTVFLRPMSLGSAKKMYKYHYVATGFTDAKYLRDQMYFFTQSEWERYHGFSYKREVIEPMTSNDRVFYQLVQVENSTFEQLTYDREAIFAQSRYDAGDDLFYHIESTVSHPDYPQSKHWLQITGFEAYIFHKQGNATLITFIAGKTTTTLYLILINIYPNYFSSKNHHSLFLLNDIGCQDEGWCPKFFPEFRVDSTFVTTKLYKLVTIATQNKNLGKKFS